jgi:hypothetical protein
MPFGTTPIVAKPTVFEGNDDDPRDDTKHNTGELTPSAATPAQESIQDENKPRHAVRYEASNPTKSAGRPFVDVDRIRLKRLRDSERRTI